MTSHVYECDLRFLAKAILGPVWPVLVFAALVHLAVFANVLPPPRPALDVDRTVLIHQIDASQKPRDARIVLLGDSSCLMDVDAAQITKLLGEPVLNLGSLSFLGLREFGRMLEQYASANPDLHTAVLLLHPEALRPGAAQPYFQKFFEAYSAGMDPPRPRSIAGQISRLLGLEAFHNRLLVRLVPAPLPGAFGSKYGFSPDLERFMTRHRGSLIDPQAQPLRREVELRFGPLWERDSRAFPQITGVRLIVGITPVPEGSVIAEYPGRYREQLGQWAQWIGTDAVLDGLPATLPDDFFTSTTHLNERGVRFFTELLAKALAGPLP